MGERKPVQNQGQEIMGNHSSQVPLQFPQDQHLPVLEVGKRVESVAEEGRRGSKAEVCQGRKPIRLEGEDPSSASGFTDWCCRMASPGGVGFGHLLLAYQVPELHSQYKLSLLILFGYLSGGPIIQVLS